VADSTTTAHESLPHRDGRPRVEDLQALQDFFVARDWMKTKVPVDKMVDLSFLP